MRGVCCPLGDMALMFAPAARAFAADGMSSSRRAAKRSSSAAESSPLTTSGIRATATMRHISGRVARRQGRIFFVLEAKAFMLLFLFFVVLLRDTIVEKKRGYNT